MIWGVNEAALLAATFLFFALAIEVGFRIGRRCSAHRDEDHKAHVGGLQSAALLLLALLLGFSFAMAVARFDARKRILTEEANAIGSAQRLSYFLPEAQGKEARSLFAAYVEARLDFYRAGTDPQAMQTAVAEASRIEDRLWSLASAAASADRQSMLAALFAESLNEMEDDSERRLAALEDHVPGTVIFLLYFVSAVSLGLVAYGCGLARQRRLGLNTIFALLLAMVITIILDVDRPRSGLIRVNQGSMLRLKAGLESVVR